MTEDQLAVQSLLREAASAGGNGSSLLGANGSAPLTLPMLQQNQPPGMEQYATEKEKLLHDLKQRPDEATLESYNQIPVEEFGIALLRGMGWKEGMAVGRQIYDDKYAFVGHILIFLCFFGCLNSLFLWTLEFFSHQYAHLNCTHHDDVGHRWSTPSSLSPGPIASVSAPSQRRRPNRRRRTTAGGSGSQSPGKSRAPKREPSSRPPAPTDERVT